MTEKVVHKKIKVNYWRTRFHDEKLGLYQSLKYRAKTRWFSQNFSIEGLVEVDGKKKFIIAYNKDEWEESILEKRRLRLRIFTIMEESLRGRPKGGNYKGGFELSITHSLIQSFEIKHSAPIFFVQIPARIYLIKFVRGWRIIGSRWYFPLLPEMKHDNLQIIKARGVVGPGRNYKLYLGKKKIARVDGQPLRKNFAIEIYDEEYAKDKTFVKYMILFGCMCNFMNESIKLIKKLYKKMKHTGTTEYKPSYNEITLFRNPRMMRR